MAMLLLMFLFLQGDAGQREPAKPLPELGAFLQGVRAHLRSDRLLLSQYTYTLKQTERQLDKKGNVKKSSVRVYEVYPSLEEGFTYMRLISKDGKLLSAKEFEKEDAAHDKRVREHARKLEHEGTDDKTHRLSKEAEERRKEDETIDELFKLYEIRMIGRQNIDRHPAIQLTFRPRPDYRPKSKDAGILQKFAGEAWRGEEDDELIRVHVELLDTLSFGLGVLARLNKGASATFQRRHVNDEIWLPAEAHFTGSARILLLKGLNIDATSEFSDYKKFSVSTSVKFSGQQKP